MMNYIWVTLIGISVVAGICTGSISDVQDNLFAFADSAVELAIGLIGVMPFFCGLMKVMEDAGLCEKLGRFISPVMRLLFPDVPKDHPANSAIAMYVAASMMGLGNAATPFGIKAMEEMDRLNTKKGVASNDMALFLVLNAACIQLVPSTVLSIRAAVGSTNPGAIILPAIISTGTAAIVGVICCKILQRYF